MRYVNEDMQTISSVDTDLTKGKLVDVIIVKESATPIDNVNKFAWDDDDYETAKMYIPNPPVLSTPSVQDRIEAQVSYTAMMTNTLLEESK